MASGMVPASEDESSGYTTAGIGDDHGIREYPFITNPKVLSINRKLNELHRKILLQDFIAASSDFDCCPKGSGISSRTSVPGPYFSCPMLHGSGDDFLKLPFPKRYLRSKSISSMTRKNKRKQVCRKCRIIAFNHFDGINYHENYLKYCTYARLKSGYILSSYKSGRVIDEKAKGDKVNDDDSDSDLTLNPNSSTLADLKNLMDPRKSQLLDDLKKSNWKRKGKTTSKIAVRSRYNSTNRRPRLNGTATQSDKAHTRTDQAVEEEEKVPKNPFPMPDIFEEIYFGSMPESFSTLPVPLQNFKNCQMKMATEVGAVENSSSVEQKKSSHPNRNPFINQNQTSLASTLKAPLNILEALPNQTKNRMRELGSIKNVARSKLNCESLHAIKKKSAMLLTLRKSQQKVQLGSSRSVTRKNKSNSNVASRGSNRKCRTPKLTNLKDDAVVFAKAPDFSFLSREEKGKKSEKYHETVTKFVETQTIPSCPQGDSATRLEGAAETIQVPESPRKRTSAKLTFTIYKSTDMKESSSTFDLSPSSDLLVVDKQSNSLPIRRKKGSARARTTVRATTAKPVLTQK